MTTSPLRTRLEAAFGDPELPRLGTGLNVSIRLRGAGAPVCIEFDDGRPHFIEDSGAIDLDLAASSDAWDQVLATPPPPTFQAFTALILVNPAFAIAGDPLLIAQARPVLERLFECLVASPASLGPTPVRDLTQIEGRYRTIACGDGRYDVFADFAGRGKPVLFLHTAGSDARQ